MTDKVTREWFEKETKGKTVVWKTFNGWEFVDLPSADGKVMYRFSRSSSSDEYYSVKELKVRTDIKLA